MSSILQREYPLEEIEHIFSGDQFYIKLFKNLMHAVTNNDFSVVSSTPGMIEANYQTIRAKVESFIRDQIYDPVFESAAYDSLVNALIDIYSVYYTVADIRKNIMELDYQPDEVVDAFLDEFGFGAKGLFSHIQRREIAKVVYWYMRRKGTPSIIIRLLDMLGFSYFYICEYELCLPEEEYAGLPVSTDDSNNLILEDDNKSLLRFKSRFLYEEKPARSSIGFYEEHEYSYQEIANKDPLLLAEEKEIINNEMFSLPAQSPYYQIGAAVTYSNLEKIYAAFSYAMTRKILKEDEMGENVFLLSFPGYPKRISFVSLIMGYAYILGNYFGVFDSFSYQNVEITEDMLDSIRQVKNAAGLGVSNEDFAAKFPELYPLYNTSFLENIYGAIDFLNLAENDNVSESSVYDSEKYSTESKLSGTPNLSLDSGVKIESLAADYDGGLFKQNHLVWGWNKTVDDVEPSEIMAEIDKKVKELCERIVWFPPSLEAGSQIARRENTIFFRKNRSASEIRELFLSPPIFNSFENMVKVFEKHDPGFMGFLDSKMLSFEGRLALLEKDGGDEDIAKHFDEIVSLLDNILESIEYFIFDKTGLMLPVRNMALSYSRVLEMIETLDKKFAPYNAKLINPAVVWLIRDFPGDCVAAEEKIGAINRDAVFHDVVWRASHYGKMDVSCPDAYAPILDWTSDGTDIEGGSFFVQPHIPANVPPAEIESGSILVRDFDKSTEVADHKYVFPESALGVTKESDVLYKIDEVNNSSIYCVGYNWLNLRYENLVVRGEKLRPHLDWDPDRIKNEKSVVLASAFNTVKPDHETLKRLKEIASGVRKLRKNIFVYSQNIIGGSSSYDIMHNLGDMNTIVTIYDTKTGFNVIPKSIKRISRACTRIQFDNKLPADSIFKVVIFGGTSVNKEYSAEKNRVVCLGFDIVGNGTSERFLVRHNLGTNNFEYEVYDRNSGRKIECMLRRVNENESYLKFDEPLEAGRLLRIVVLAFVDENCAGKTDPLFGSFTVYPGDGAVEIEHNFYNCNFISRVYSVDNAADIKDIEITRISSSKIRLAAKSSRAENCRVILMGSSMRNKAGYAIPLNNIAAFSDSIIGDGVSREFRVNHNLDSFDTFEQVFSVDDISGAQENGLVRVSIVREDKNNVVISFLEPPVFGKRYSINIFSPISDTSVFPPSLFYNTHLESFFLASKFNRDSIRKHDFPETEIYRNVEVSENSDGTVDYVVTHNLGTQKISGQLFDSHGIRVDSLMSIIDSNKVRVSLSSLIEDNEVFRLNLLSVPGNTSDFTYSNSRGFDFVDSFVRNIPHDCLSDTFTVCHNLGTEKVLVNVFNRKTGETVETYVAINDDNNVTVAFKDTLGSHDRIFDGGRASTVIFQDRIEGGFASTEKQEKMEINKYARDLDSSYFIVIIASKKIGRVSGFQEYSTIDSSVFQQPHFYFEEIKSENDRRVIRSAWNIDYQDMSAEEISNSENYKTYDTGLMDLPQIREFVEIIHETRNKKISDCSTEILGTNIHGVLTNDPVYGFGVANDR